MTQRTRSAQLRLFLLGVMAVVLIVAGCGGDDDEETTAPTAAPTSTSAPADPSPDSEPTAEPVSVPDTTNAAWRDDRFDFSLDASIEGLRLYDFEYSENNSHAPGQLYEDMIPVGGEHSSLWQYCGAYDVELFPERAIHAMEHGAVWIAHRGDVDMSRWAAEAADETHLLVAPAGFLEVPIVVSAWGAQLDSNSPDDPRIDAFIERFLRQGPENAGCVRGGVGLPPDDKGPGLDL